MSIATKPSDRATRFGCHESGQMHLPLEVPSTFPEPRDLHLAIKKALATDIKECCWSREQIVQRLALLTGRPVGISTLDAMVAETKDHRFPAEWIPAWVLSTGSTRLLNLLCSESGLFLSDATEHDLAELARLNIATRQATKRAEKLRQRLEAEL